MRKFSRKYHKLIFIYLGIFVFLWLITGTIMSIPDKRHWVEIFSKGDAKLSYNSISLSPAEIITSLKKNQNIENIKQIQLSTIGKDIMYVAQDEKNINHLVNAQSGDYYRFTMADAVIEIPKVFDLKQPLTESTLINEHDLDYLWGALPVYKLKYGDSSDVYYVDPVSVKVLRLSNFATIRNVSGMLHTLDPIRIVTGSEKLKWALMLIIGLISTVGTILGIYLTLPMRKKSRK